MRFFSFLCPLLYITIACLQPAAAEPIIVSGNPEAPPIVWEKKGELVGVGPEIARQILTTISVPFILKPNGSWEQVQEKIKSGSIDIIVSAYDNRERRQYMDYSIPYLQSPVVIVVKKGETFPFTSWNDLIGKKGVANTGESFGEDLDAFIKEKLDIAYVPYQRAFEMMNLNTADYLIVDLYPAIIYSKLLNVENSVEFLDTPATVQNFHITLSKKSPYRHLLPQINAQIEQMKKTGFFKKLAREQYKQWNTTFQERQRFFSQSHAKAQQQQSTWNADARDQGLENLTRFIERDIPYMSGSNSIE